MIKYNSDGDECIYCPLLKQDVTLGYCDEICMLRYDGKGGVSEQTFVDSMGCKELVFETISKIGDESARTICNSCIRLRLRKESGKYDPKYDEKRLSAFVFDFLFEHHDNCIDEYDEHWDLVEVVITDSISKNKTKLPVDITTFDYREDNFERYHTPMVVVDGIKGSMAWNHLVPVSISEDPKILISDELLQKRSDLNHEEWDAIFKFISRNHDLLSDKWYCRNQFEQDYTDDIWRY